MIRTLLTLSLTIGALLVSCTTGPGAKPTVVIEQIGFGFPGSSISFPQIKQSNSFYATAIIKITMNGLNPVAVESTNSSAVKLVYDWKIQDANVATIVGDGNQGSVMLQTSKTLGLLNPNYFPSNPGFTNCGITLSIKDKDDGTVYARSTAVFQVGY